MRGKNRLVARSEFRVLSPGKFGKPSHVNETVMLAQIAADPFIHDLTM